MRYLVMTASVSITFYIGFYILFFGGLIEFYNGYHYRGSAIYFPLLKMISGSIVSIGILTFCFLRRRFGMSQTDVYAEKRQKAIELLGKNWVLHPEYEKNPKHSLIGIQTGKYLSYHAEKQSKK